jgi:sec-independent protein translocase protein TatA
MNASLLAIMGLGPMELVIVGVVVLLLFGSRLPSVMHSMGKGITQFKKGLNDTSEDDPKEVTSSKSNP